jgi:uncharacterized iron-regulated membrane protein
MSAPAFAAKIRQHWTKWHPKKVAALKADGSLDREIQAVAKRAQQQMLDLMEQGYRAHEAEEVVLAEVVLLPPEDDAALEPWERKELAEKESEYQKLSR